MELRSVIENNPKGSCRWRCMSVLKCSSFHPQRHFHMIILIAWSEHKLFGSGNLHDRNDPETYYLNESNANKEPYSDTCRSLVVEVKTKSCLNLCRNLFTSFTSNLSDNVLVSLVYCWRNLTSVGNVCEAAPRSLFCAQNRLNVLREVCFEFSLRPFFVVHTQILVHTGEAQNNYFGAVSQTNLTRA